eukprot:TRINITY_DN8572_c0_g1_i1.p1 TRINITY_DN8572_c0_g1~~TRINITY_DN8572_c0_g1_i1.p1  ORF type:complete len:615 (-),score=27.06 TRINITY_DN8572_c0_g1_i1:159-2003(-)
MTFLPRLVRCSCNEKRKPDASVQDVRSSIDIVDLGRGIVWICAPLDDEFSPSSEDARKIIEALCISSESCPSASDVMGALLNPKERNRSQHVRVLVPEASPDQCEWDGDGLYNTNRLKKVGLPTLGHIVEHVTMLDATASEYRLTIHMSSPKRRACGALLSGAVLVLSSGLSAKAAWKQILNGCSVTSEAGDSWDRFLGPFSKSRKKTDTSLRIFDCLEALEFAEQNGWLGPHGYSSFDVDQWRQLRKVADASWIIPGEVLAMAHPLGTAQNPMLDGAKLDSLFRKESPSRAAHRQDHSNSLSALFPSEGEVSIRDEGDIAGPSNVSVCCNDKSGTFADTVCSSRKSSKQSVPSVHSADWSGWASQAETSSDPVVRMDCNKGKAIATCINTSERSDSTGDGDDSKSRVCTARCTERSDRCDGRHIRAEQHLDHLSRLMSHVCDDGISTVFQVNHNFECAGHEEYMDVLSKVGLHHQSFSFEDGGVPSRAASLAFVEACREQMENGQAQFVVHCKGGLGRTSVMIGTYAVATYGISGTAFHGWVRMCRPGSVQTQPQEAYLRQLRPSKKSGSRLPSKQSTGRKPSKQVSIGRAVYPASQRVDEPIGHAEEQYFSL